MAVKINNAIPQQNFELIRDRIGLILKEEIDNQANTLISDPDLNASVWVERFVPFDKSDFPCVNILFSGGPFENINTVSVTGVYTFLIDVYTSSPTTTGQDGDQKASFVLQRLLGIIRAILENPVYRILDFNPGTVLGTEVENLGVMDPQNNQDATSTIKGRVTLKVKACETTQLLDASPIEGFETAVKINLTDKGYKYEIN